MKWQDLKDLFKSEGNENDLVQTFSGWFTRLFLLVVGPVKFSEIFLDEHGKSKGSGVIEFETNEGAEDALKKMHRHEINGRKIIVRRDMPEGGGRRRDDSPDRHDRDRQVTQV